MKPIENRAMDQLPDKPPLSNTIGIGFANEEMLPFVQKGTKLPAHGTNDFRTDVALRAGHAEDVWSFSILEGENARAVRNHLIGMITITGADIRRDLPAGSQIEVKVMIDESQQIRAQAYVPALDEEFVVQISLQMSHESLDELRKQVAEQQKRLKQAREKLGNNRSPKAAAALARIEDDQLLNQVESLVVAAAQDPDALQQLDRRVRDLAAAVDEVEDAMKPIENDNMDRLGQEYREAVYASIQTALAVATTRKDFEVIAAQCESIAGYRDADDILRDARRKMESLAGQPDLDEVIAQRTKVRAKRRKACLIAFAALAVAGALAGTGTVLHRNTLNQRYQNAVSLNRGVLEQYGEGEFAAAKMAFTKKKYGAACNRLAEAIRKASERKRVVEADQNRLAAELARERFKEEERKRVAEMERLRLAEEKRVAEERRLAEEQRLAVERRLAEEKRLVEERRATEERRLVEERRVAEEKRLVEARRAAEERRVAEEADRKRMIEETERNRLAVSAARTIASKPDYTKRQEYLAEFRSLIKELRPQEVKLLTEDVEIIALAEKTNLARQVVLNLDNQCRDVIDQKLSEDPKLAPLVVKRRELQQTLKAYRQASLAATTTASKPDLVKLREMFAELSVLTKDLRPQEDKLRTSDIELKELVEKKNEALQDLMSLENQRQVLIDRKLSVDPTLAPLVAKRRELQQTFQEMFPSDTERQRFVAEGARQAGDSISVDLGDGVKLELVWCPAGSFTMGSPADEATRFNDETQHRVTLTKGFWMGKTEVTQAQWEQVMGSKPSKIMGAALPVERVSWTDCQEFIRHVNARVPGSGFRLPTEAEREYACRAATTSPYAGNLDDVAWYDSNSRRTTHPVGQKTPNAWNLYDMHGNVGEWCADWYGDYPSGSVTDPAGPGSGSLRVFRGGSWFNGARACCSANRGRRVPGGRSDDLGLRLARTLP